MKQDGAKDEAGKTARDKAEALFQGLAALSDGHDGFALKHFMTEYSGLVFNMVYGFK